MLGGRECWSKTYRANFNSRSDGRCGTHDYQRIWPHYSEELECEVEVDTINRDGTGGVVLEIGAHLNEYAYYEAFGISDFSISTPCECDAGWNGARCELDCASDEVQCPCNHPHGQARPGGTCDCASGYAGQGWKEHERRIRAATIVTITIPPSRGVSKRAPPTRLAGS